MVVFVVKRYAVREAKKWWYAVRNAKIERYAVLKGGGGVTLIYECKIPISVRYWIDIIRKTISDLYHPMGKTITARDRLRYRTDIKGKSDRYRTDIKMLAGAIPKRNVKTTLIFRLFSFR